MTKEEQLLIETLYRDNFESMYYYALSVLKDKTAAENVVNDTFVEAIRKAGLLAAHPNQKGWLRSALKLGLKSCLRARGREQTRILPLEAADQVPAGGSNLESDADLLLAPLKKSLTPEEFQFFEAYYKYDLTHSQLAERFGISVSASQKRLERIRKKLQKEWKSDHF